MHLLAPSAVLLALFAPPEKSEPGADVPALVARYLESDSDAERREILAALEGVAPDRILATARRAPARPAIRPGTSVHPLRIRGTELESRYVLVIPEGYDPARAWPVFLAQHGTSGYGRDVARMLAPEAERGGFVLACPTEHESRQGKGWGFTREERALAISVLEDVKRRVHVDTDRVVLCGWSRGGHATYDVAVHHPALFAGILPVIGAPRAVYFGMLRSLSPIRCRILNGAKDASRLMVAARNGAEYLARKVQADVEYVEDPERGHDLLLDRLPPLVDALLEARRDPLAEHLLVAAYEAAPTEGLWIRIDEVRDDAYRPGDSLRVSGIRGRSEESKLSAFHDAAFDATAFADAKRGRNAFTLKTSRVERVTLLVAEEAIDWNRPVRVNTNGRRAFSGRLERDPAVLLEGLRQRRDPQRLFFAEIEVAVEGGR